MPLLTDIIAAALEAAGTQAVVAGADALREVAATMRNPSAVAERAGLEPATSYDDADELAEAFHGRPPIDLDVDTPTAPHTPDNLGGLGLLHSLTFVALEEEGETEADDVFEDIDLKFDTSGELEPIIVAADPSNHQLYLVGGADQQSPFASQFEDETGRYVPLGPLVKIEYITDKHHLEGHEPGELVQYWHRFGEVTGEQPGLVYDMDSQTFLIQGGRYSIEPEGISN